MRRLAFPFAIDERGRTAEREEERWIRDLIEQVLFTRPGERVNRPTFGGGVHQLTFEPNSPEIAAAIQFMVRGALQQTLGDLVLIEDVVSESVDATLIIRVSYIVRRTQERMVAHFEHVLEAPRGIGG